MPQVPGTKVWLRKEELMSVLKLMNDDYPPERQVRALDFAMRNIKRCKQAKASISLVYHFIVKQWFHMHDSEA
jgi:hypothetical protein